MEVEVPLSHEKWSAKTCRYVGALRGLADDGFARFGMSWPFHTGTILPRYFSCVGHTQDNFEVKEELERRRT